MSHRWAVVLVVLTAILTWHVASSAGSSGRVTRSITTFTCCTGGDVNTVYHPGDMLTIHWIRDTEQGSAPPYPVAVTLRAHLSGGFASVARAKALSASALRQEQARPVVVTDRTTAAPVSRIRIPASAVPGFYNLTTSVAAYGSTVSGTTTIRVAGG